MEQAIPDTPPPEYQSETEIGEDDNTKETPKPTMKKKLSRMRSTPFLLAYALVVCVFLPMAIYACDVIISVNVLQRHTLWKTVFNEQNNYALYPKLKEVTGKRYTIDNSVLHTFQVNIDASRNLLKDKQKSKRNKRQIGSSSSVETINIAPTDLLPANATDTNTFSLPATTSRTEKERTTIAFVTTTPPITTVQSVTDETNSTINPINTTTSASNSTFESTTTLTTVNNKEKKENLTSTTTSYETTTIFETTIYNISHSMQKKGEFCRGLNYFYEIHLNYSDKHWSDWFEDQMQSLRNKQQTLFFMFTVIGFIFLLSAFGIRSEMFLNDEWSSYIVFPFLLYSISMAITVAVFAQENASGGLRCFVCRLSNCSDIEPWNLVNHWPKVPNDSWALAAIVSFFLKACDCFLIGTVTLKFIWNGCNDPCWKISLKIAGWLFFFPLLIFTPMLGVIRYQVVPWVIPDCEAIRITSEIFFYFGVALWAITIVALPLFCKLRMCGKTQEDLEKELEQ